MNDEIKILGVKDVSQFIGMSVSNIDKMQADKIFPVADFLIGRGKIRKWKLSSVISWLEKECKNPKMVNYE